MIDATAVTPLEPSIEEAKILASGSAFFSPSSRRAWVATSPFVFGMARLIDAYHEMAGGREQLCAFYDRDEALKWLGLDEDPRAVR